MGDRVERVLVEDEGAQPRRRTVRSAGGHGDVISERRSVEVVVRGQMDGIRPIETAVLTYVWHAPPLDASGHPMVLGGVGWQFLRMDTQVQGLGGELKPGTVLMADDLRMLGPSVRWAWDLVQRHRPRG
jgi:hypothetical protein